MTSCANLRRICLCTVSCVPDSYNHRANSDPRFGQRGAGAATGRPQTPSGRPSSGDGASSSGDGGNFGDDEGRTLSQRLRRSAAVYKDDPIPTQVRVSAVGGSHGADGVLYCFFEEGWLRFSFRRCQHVSTALALLVSPILTVQRYPGENKDDRPPGPLFRCM